jgi:hypothetical protein
LRKKTLIKITYVVWFCVVVLLFTTDELEFEFVVEFVMLDYVVVFVYVV